MTKKALEGKKTIVTGASSGMGDSIAMRFAMEGADLWAVGGGNVDALKKTIAACRRSGSRADGKGYDFANSREGGTAVREGSAFLGGLDILVNCAGTRNFQPLIEVQDEEIDRMFEVNIKSFYFAAREAAKIMVPQKSGHILMMGSTSGHRARPNRTLYCGTKGAMELFTKSLAMELGPYGIQVNCIAPGLIATGRTEKRIEDDPERYKRRVKGIALGRMGSADSIATAAVFLVSSENDFMSGAVVAIDGATMSG